MAKQLKCSSHCKETFKVVEQEVIFSCQETLITEEDKNFFNCVFFDMGLLDQCQKCYLKCKNNTNPELKKQEKIKSDMNKIIKKLPMGYGVSYDSAESIVNKMKESNINEKQSDALQAASFSGTLLNKVMSGKHIDLSELKIIKQYMSKKILKKK
jgi:hypothetical protein